MSLEGNESRKRLKGPPVRWDRYIITERSPTAIRTHLLVNTHILTQYAAVRAATEAFLAVGWMWGQDFEWSSVDGRPRAKARAARTKESEWKEIFADSGAAEHVVQ